MNADFNSYLQLTGIFEANGPHVQEFLARIPKKNNAKDQAIAIYECVREAFIYDPYHLDLREDGLKVEKIVQQKRAWCVEKAVVATACFRYFGIPARLGFGIVTNHLGAEKLEHYLRKKEIVFHGFSEVYLNDSWIKCTPAFDRRVCRLNGVEPLQWDGIHDSLLQAYKGEERFMEYIHFYGSFETVPYELMHQEMQAHYPHLFEHCIEGKEFSFHFEKKYL